MFLELERVPLEGQAVDRVFALGSLPAEDDEYRLTSETALQARLERVELESDEEAGSFRLRGVLSCQIEVECVRCLEPVRRDVREQLDLLFLPQSRNRAPAADEEAEREPSGLEAEDLAVSFYRDDQIDLGQMIREQILLSLPMKPLCREDCRGLCPGCGVNRNSTECDCSKDDSDPRWSTLKSLLGR